MCKNDKGGYILTEQEEMEECFQRAIKRGKITKDDIIGLNMDKCLDAIQSELDEAKDAYKQGALVTYFIDGKPEGLIMELFHIRNTILTAMKMLGFDYKKEHKIMLEYERKRED